MSGTWSWPFEGDPREPFGDDTGGRSAFARAVAAAEAGLAPSDELLHEARRLGLTGALAPDTSPPEVPETLPSDADLVRVATEHDPGVAASAADQVLGPWADGADRHTRLVAVAWGALFPGDGWDTSPVSRWLRSRPGPPLAVRSGVVAVHRTPPALWRITALRGDTVELADVLGLEAPTGPVLLRRPAVPVGEPAVGGALAARIVRTTRGWEAVAPIVVPWVPAVVARWQLWGPLAARAADGRVRTLPDVLRARGHHLARRLLETAWPELG